MKFEMSHKVGTDHSTVILSKFIYEKFRRYEFKDKIFETFFRLGAVQKPNTLQFQFPKHINSQIIEEVIRNTCFVCGGLMKDGTAMVDQVFEFEHDLYGTVTQQVPGYAKKTKVRKCSSCGHSHT